MQHADQPELLYQAATTNEAGIPERPSASDGATLHRAREHTLENLSTDLESVLGTLRSSNVPSSTTLTRHNAGLPRAVGEPAVLPGLILVSFGLGRGRELDLPSPQRGAGPRRLGAYGDCKEIIQKCSCSRPFSIPFFVGIEQILCRMISIDKGRECHRRVMSYG